MPDLTRDPRPKGEGPHRSSVTTTHINVDVTVPVRLQWEYDHWIAVWRGVTGTGMTQIEAIGALRPGIRAKLEGVHA